MKTMKHTLLVAILALAFVACKNDKSPEVKTVEVETATKEKVLNPDATYAKAEFGIEGMTCEIGCAKTIEKKLAKMDGVKSAKVDFGRELAMVEYDEAMVTTDLLSTTVSNVADTYKVKDMKTVEDFSKETKCEMDCCKGKTDEEKAKCQMACCQGEKSEGNKMACKEDCKKECCVKKA